MCIRDSSTPVLTQERLRVRQERHHKLITMWDQVLGDTGALFEQKDFTLLLADPQGVVLAQAAVSTSGVPEVTKTSSSMRMPMPRKRSGASMSAAGT